MDPMRKLMAATAQTSKDISQLIKQQE
jgi:hypothetical protein